MLLTTVRVPDSPDATGSGRTQPRPRPPFSSVRISPIDAGIRSDLDAALQLVRPLPDGLLDVYALSTEINSSRVEGIQPLTPLHG